MIDANNIVPDIEELERFTAKGRGLDDEETEEVGACVCVSLTGRGHDLC